jgi:hypothetical protein
MICSERSIAWTEIPEIDTPRSLTAFSSGNAILNKSTVADSRSLRLSTELDNVRLRVINSKSANFTLRVTVRPRVPLSSQCRQTLSISGCSSDTIASNSVRSLEKVFSAPMDLRTRSAFFTLVGCHGLHVTAGLVWLVVMMAQVAVKGLHATVERRLLCFSLFWHALDIVWVWLFTVVYLMGVLL